MVEEGADIVDIGAESTRPGASPVGEAEELARLMPVLEGLRGAGRALSVDTSKPGVMSAAIAAGADIVNDIRALQAPGALESVARSGAAVCLMHMQGEPRTMQSHPSYVDVVAEVRDFLRARARACEDAGIARDRIMVDPGFGFGKTLQHNLRLLHELDALCALGYPVVAGFSRKSSLGGLTGKPAGDRLAASLAVALIAVQRGARILRVHDVAETRDVLAVWSAIEQRASPPGSCADPER